MAGVCSGEAEGAIAGRDAALLVSAGGLDWVPDMTTVSSLRMKWVTETRMPSLLRANHRREAAQGENST